MSQGFTEIYTLVQDTFCEDANSCYILTDSDLF